MAYLNPVMQLFGTRASDSKFAFKEYKLREYIPPPPPQRLSEQNALGETPKSDQRVCSFVSRASARAQRGAKNMHSQC